MKLLQLEYFLAVCDCSSLTRASRKLRVSQPSLSGVMRELEAEFGVPLFLRLSHGLSPTEAGAVLRRESEKLLTQAGELRTRMAALSSGVQTLRLGVPPMLSSLILPRLLRAVRQCRPELRLELVERGSPGSAGLLLNGGLDAAIVSSTVPPDPALGRLLLRTLDICFCTAFDSPLAAGDRAELSTLADVPLALLSTDSFLTGFVLEHFRALGVEPSVLVNTNQLDAIRRLVEDGTASAFLYEGVLTGRRVKTLPAGLPPVSVRLLWNGDAPSDAVRALVEVAASEFGV